MSLTKVTNSMIVGAPINALDYGVVGDGVADDASALLFAAAACVASGRPLYMPRGYTVRLSSSVDLRGIKYIDFQADIVIPSGRVTVGGFFNDGDGVIRFANVTNGTSLFGAPPATPVLRVTGVSQSFIQVGSCNYLQLYADSAISNDRSVSYNQWRINGMVTLLELTDSGGALSYVNENFIYADRIVKYKIIGVGYDHNHNKLFHPCMEGADVSLTFTKCYVNQVYGARFEETADSAGVTFAASSYSNSVFGTWSGTGNPYGQFTTPIPVTDAGEGNMVTSESASMFRKTPILSVGPNSLIVATSSDSVASDMRIAPKIKGIDGFSDTILVPSLNGVFNPTAFGRIAASDLIPVQLGDVVVWDLDFEGAFLRPIIWVYDENMTPLTSEGTGGKYISMVDTGFDSTYGFYGATSDLTKNCLPAAVVRPEVKFIRVGFTSSTAHIYRYLGASIFTQSLKRGPTEGEAMIRNSVANINDVPTRGYAPTGFSVFDRTAKIWRWVAFQYETTLNGALVAGATSVTVIAPGTIANGDLCGILLDDDQTHWSAISGLSGSTFTITAIPPGRTAPNKGRIVFNRWTS
jgi:hypothetical protein